MSDDAFATVGRAQRERNEAKAGKKSKSFDPKDQRNGNPSKASLTEAFDTSLYDGNGVDKYAGYNMSIAANDEDDDMEDAGAINGRRLVGQYTATKEQLNEYAEGDTAEADILQSREQRAQIASRETDYQQRRFNRRLSPTRADPYAKEGNEGATFNDIMNERALEREEERVRRIIEEKEARGEGAIVEHRATLKDGTPDGETTPPMQKKRKRRWGTKSGPEDEAAAASKAKEKTAEEKLVTAEQLIDEEDGMDVDPAAPPKSRWDATPAMPVAKRSRFDQAPEGDSSTSNAPDATPAPANGLATPAPAQDVSGMSVPGGRPMAITDEELDRLLPSEGYKILEPPEGYVPVRAPAHRAANLPVGYQGFTMQDSSESNSMMGKQLPSEIPGVGDLQFFKAEDMKYFGKLVDGQSEVDMSVEELKERKIMRLLLKVKNGTPPMRKTALRQLTDGARSFGAGPLFNQLLPLLMERTLEDQERHLLVKVVDRVLYKLDELVRPYTHKILVVIEPLLIDQDYYARVEGKEIISNLSKAAGLAHMITTMRPDLDHSDEYVRNTTARAFAVVASALGIPAIIPFLRAVCRSKKSWQARHTGVKIVQQIPILMGCAVLPHLKPLIGCLEVTLNDEQPKVRMVTALAVAALAEASTPYGIESFDQILNPLWTGARRQRGKSLASFLKAVGYIIPLMDAEYANYYTSQIMEIVIREMASPDEEMKKVVLKLLSQCSATEGVTGGYLRQSVMEDYFRNFWVRRIALDKRNYSAVITTTLDLTPKVGPDVMLAQIVPNLKDETEAYRKMTMETIMKIVVNHGATSIDQRLEELLMDGLLFAFQEQTVEDPSLLDGFGAVVNALGERTKPYIPQIVSTILWRLNNKSPTVRQQAADLVIRIAGVMSACGEDELLGKVSQILYEYLGEEYPEVLGSILGALRSIVGVVGVYSMKPPIKDLLPRLTPILRNRHEKVQENCIDLVGRIADRGADVVNAREWMRICFELLDLLKAHKKGIRRAANNTFGFISKAIGPQDVLATLLNNLRVQERQSRVCTAVAIGIVAEACSPFTVLPALMNEYRVPELNVQNGVLKSLSFTFEYIGEVAKDYVYSVVPLIEDALIDRDQVHRQTAASVVKHLAIGCVGLDCEDAMVHFLNLLMPNLFETSPHVIDRIIEAIDGVRNAVGTPLVMNYILAGLFHPARKVRQPYWRIYNDAYVQSADAMVPAYPQIDDDMLKRPELDIFI